MNNKTKPVSFRLDAEAKNSIEKRSKVAGVSVSEFARKVVLEALSEESELARLRLKVGSLEQDLKGLREDLAVAVKALLVTIGSEQKITAEQAEAWVSSNMNT